MNISDANNDDEQPISVADPHLRKTRVLSHPCRTCVFNPGNPMHLEPGRLRELVQAALDRQSYIICHDTLPYAQHAETGPAVCRGFYNRYDTTALQLARRLWGIIAVSPPEDEPPHPTAAEDPVTGPRQPDAATTRSTSDHRDAGKD